MGSSTGTSRRGVRVLRLGRAILVACVAVLVLVLGAASPASAVTMVRRFCNVKNGSHFWSASGQECADTPLDSMRTTFNYEGIAWAIKDGGSVTVYRARNTKNGAHFYTASKAEYDGLTAPFVREGPSFTTWSSGTVVYRYYYKPIGSHFYTSNPNELAGNPNFQYEGPAFCVQTTSPIINTHRRWPNNANEGGLTCKVPVNYQALPDEWELIVRDARVEWNDIGRSKMCFVFADSTGANVFVRDYYGMTGWTGQTLVFPLPSYNAGVPITGAMTQLNRSYNLVAGVPTATQYDLRSVVTHELGHWVCELDDYYLDQDWYWATMDGHSQLGRTHQRTLAAEDIDGMRSTYGSR